MVRADFEGGEGCRLFACPHHLAALLVICIFGIEKLIGFLWAVEAPMLFGRVPLAYVSQAIDFGVLVVFGWRGIQAADRAFRDD